MKKILSIAVVILTILFVMFIIQNAATVYVDFIFWTLEISFSLLMIICTAIGFLIGMLVYSRVGKSETVATPEPAEQEPSPRQDGDVE